MDPLPRDLSDVEVVDAVVSGDRSQFVQIVRRYQSALIRVAESRLGSTTYAEDAVQETFLAAFKSLHTFDSRYNFRTWLWTISLNQCRRLALKQSRQPRSTSSAGEESDQTLRSIMDLPSNFSPLAKLLQDERAAQLNALLNQLPEQQADALRLRFYGGLSFPEIAAIMNSAISTAKIRVRNGLLQLAEWLRSDGITLGGSEFDYETND